MSRTIHVANAVLYAVGSQACIIYWSSFTPFHLSIMWAELQSILTYSSCNAKCSAPTVSACGFVSSNSLHMVYLCLCFVCLPMCYVIDLMFIVPVVPCLSFQHWPVLVSCMHVQYHLVASQMHLVLSCFPPNLIELVP